MFCLDAGATDGRTVRGASAMIGWCIIDPTLASFTNASASVCIAGKPTDDPAGEHNEPKYFQDWARQLLKPRANVHVQYQALDPHRPAHHTEVRASSDGPKLTVGRTVFEMLLEL